MRRLRHGEWIAGLSAAALLGLLFADWFDVLYGVYCSSARCVHSSIGASGWSSLGWAALLFCLLAVVAALGLVFAAATHESPVLPVFATIATTILGGGAVIALVVQVLTRASGAGVDAPFWLGLAAAVGVTVGGYTALHDDRTPHARERPVEARPLPPVA